MLTEREQEVLEQVVRGFTTKEIAFTLQLSPRTVEVYRASVLHKLGARNTADLVRKAIGLTAGLPIGQRQSQPKPQHKSDRRAEAHTVSHRPPPEVLAERDLRLELPRTPNTELLGDPVCGRSALDQRAKK